MFGADRDNFTLSDFELLRISFVLAGKMKTFEVKAIDKARTNVASEWLDELIENKIGAYREFRPLDLLLEDALRASTIRFERVIYFPSIWHLKAKQEGVKINARSGNTSLYVTDKALIKTQSASDAGMS